MDYRGIESYKYKDLEKFTYAQLEGESRLQLIQNLILYAPFETDFTHNGLAVLDIVEDGVVVEELNGDYYLEAIIHKDERGKYKRIKDLSIIKARGQLFRIPSADYIKEGKYSITIYAKHIFYDIKEVFVEDRRVREQTVDIALSRILESDVRDKFILGLSDITATANANFILNDGLECIFNKVLPRWGGELFRSNYTFAIKQRLGKYKGDLYVRYGKNSTSIKKRVDYNDVCTRVYPVGKNGLVFSKLNGGKAYIDSSLRETYPIYYTKRIKFEEAETEEELLAQANSYLKAYEKPLVTITVDVIDLSVRKEYSSLKTALTLELGDTVVIVDKDLDIREEQRVIKVTRQAVTGIITEIVLGDKVPTLTDSMDDSDKAIDNTNDKVDDIANSTANNDTAIKSINEEIANIYKDTNSLTTSIGEIRADIGDKTTLQTTFKDNLVGAINEVKKLVGTGGGGGGGGSSLLDIITVAPQEVINGSMHILKEFGVYSLLVGADGLWKQVKLSNYNPLQLLWIGTTKSTSRTINRALEFRVNALKNIKVLYSDLHIDITAQNFKSLQIYSSGGALLGEYTQIEEVAGMRRIALGVEGINISSGQYVRFVYNVNSSTNFPVYSGDYTGSHWSSTWLYADGGNVSGLSMAVKLGLLEI